jgi:colanic acid biosynthesis glycosyl transferase WcaI
MRVLVNDYSGHPFQVQLSRSLARAGEDVLHLHFASFQTPKGALSVLKEDPDNFDSRGIALDEPFAKYSYLKRRSQELRYGRLVAENVRAWRPDVVISANMPLDAQSVLLRACRRMNIKFIFWLQDIYSMGIGSLLPQKLPVVGHVIAARYRALERHLLSSSDHVVCICEDFASTLRAWKIDAGKVSVVKNWAALDALPLAPRANAWSAEHGLDDKFVLLYSGTLGLKHDPALLVALARRFAERGNIMVVVVSEGPSADWLRAQSNDGLKNLLVVPFQPFDRLPEVFASGDVLLAILSKDSGVFSVPSKVLSYLCAGRPLLASIPLENLAARIIAESGGGIVVPPPRSRQDYEPFLAAAESLVNDETKRGALGENALLYARREFDIGRVTARFERILHDTVDERAHQTSAREDRL